MVYQIEYVNAAERVIRGLPKQLQSRILGRIETLSTNPRPHGSIKLQNQDAYRIRVGDYRIIYSIHDKQLLILVIDIGHRREVYRR